MAASLFVATEPRNRPKRLHCFPATSRSKQRATVEREAAAAAEKEKQEGEAEEREESRAEMSRAHTHTYTQEASSEAKREWLFLYSVLDAIEVYSLHMHRLLFCLMQGI